MVEKFWSLESGEDVVLSGLKCFSLEKIRNESTRTTVYSRSFARNWAGLMLRKSIQSSSSD